MIDESHATIPQIGGMYEGDRSRKTVLVEYGFRLPSALDNRPLNFDEFMKMTNQIDLRERDSGGVRNSEQRGRQRRNTSRTSDSESGRTSQCRFCFQEENALFPTSNAKRPTPTGAVSRGRTNRRKNSMSIRRARRWWSSKSFGQPGSSIRRSRSSRSKNQIDDTIELCRQRVEKSERVLITTLTKRTAEDLADYLRDVGLKVRYLHSDIDTIERVEILRGLRAAEFDILVGINLLREGLDLPEVSLVCILDADKEGFLRSQTSLIQTAGRAARHVNGEVVLFADQVTQSMEALISISEYRRARQMEYNEKHGITPQTVRRAVQESLHTILRGREIDASVIQETRRRFQHDRVVARVRG